MKDKFRFPYLLVGMGLGAVAGLLLAPGAVEEMWKYLRERSHRGLDTLTKQAGTLRESAEGIVKKGREFIGAHCNSAKSDTEAEKRNCQEERRENPGG
ncbi:MAG TPA: YtxH domain-containing protein [Candidatus Binatia bacterium]